MSWKLPSFWLPSMPLLSWEKTLPSAAKVISSATVQQTQAQDNQLNPPISSKWGDAKGVQWSVESDETEPQHKIVMTPSLETLKRVSTRQKSKAANQETVDRTVQWVEAGPSDDPNVKYSFDAISEQNLQKAELLKTKYAEVNQGFTVEGPQFDIPPKVALHRMAARRPSEFVAEWEQVV